MLNTNMMTKDDLVKSADRLTKYIKLQELVSIIEYHQTAKYPTKGRSIDKNRALDWLSHSLFGKDWNSVSAEFESVSDAPQFQFDKIDNALIKRTSEEDPMLGVRLSEVSELMTELDDKLKAHLQSNQGLIVDERDFLAGAFTASMELLGNDTAPASMMFRMMSTEAIHQPEKYYIIKEVEPESEFELLSYQLVATCGKDKLSEYEERYEDYEYMILSRTQCKQKYAWNTMRNEPFSHYQVVNRESVKALVPLD